jgi:hypothetical protein
MNNLGRLSAVLTLLVAGAPALAGAACIGGEDLHALQAAALQQRLMVAALSCRDTAAYNRFVLGHRGELQKSDAALMAYFKRLTGGVAAYHTYKTHLANQASLDSSRSDDFCGRADVLFARVGNGGSLNAILDRTPIDTGYAACGGTTLRTAEQGDAPPVRRPRAVAANRDRSNAPPDYSDDRYRDPRDAGPGERSYAWRDDPRDDEDDYGPPPPREDYGPPPREDYGPPRDDRYGYDRRRPDADRDDEDDDLPFWAR